MARPKIPLISRRKTTEAALRIIDAEGLDALSVRRLAEELNINGASLYHHFKNKDEILVGAAHEALRDVRRPESSDESWRVWGLRNVQRLERALVEHPGLIPIIFKRKWLGIGVPELDAEVEALLQEGVPLAAIVPLLEFGGILAITTALIETENTMELSDADAQKYKHLKRAMSARKVSPTKVMEEAYKAGADAILAAVSRRNGRARGATSRRAPRMSPVRHSAGEADQVSS